MTHPLLIVFVQHFQQAKKSPSFGNFVFRNCVCVCVVRACVFLQDKELRYRFVYNAFPTLTEEVQY